MAVGKKKRFYQYSTCTCMKNSWVQVAKMVGSCYRIRMLLSLAFPRVTREEGERTLCTSANVRAAGMNFR